jgi:hypothetical protein
MAGQTLSPSAFRAHPGCQPGTPWVRSAVLLVLVLVTVVIWGTLLQADFKYQ